MEPCLFPWGNKAFSLLWLLFNGTDSHFNAMRDESSSEMSVALPLSSKHLIRGMVIGILTLTPELTSIVGISSC
jgi:hypothetical protein